MKLNEGTNQLVIQMVPVFGNIYGVVTFRKTGAPLEGVKISVDSIIIYSNSNGAYRIENLTPGTYTMRLDKVGYEPLWDMVKVVAGDNEINAQMTLFPALIASLHGHITDSETGNAIVSAEVTIVEHTGIMEANVYRTLSNTGGFYSLSDMALENKPIVVDISVEAGGYELIKETDVGLVEGDNTRDFDMVWRGGSRDVPSFISYQLPDQIVSGKEFPVSITIYLPYQDELFKAYLQIQLPENKRINTMERWKLLPATLYDPLRLKRDYIRFDSAGTITLEATGKAIYRTSIWLGTFAPMPPGTYDVNAFVERYHVEPINGTLKYGGVSDAYYEWGPVKVGTVQVVG